jgi:hypothetical protein
LDAYYSCFSPPIYQRSHYLFNWANASILSNLSHKLSGFCNSTNFIFAIIIFLNQISHGEFFSTFYKDCAEPLNVENAKLSFSGLSTGSYSLYQCANNTKLSGFKTSVCMVHGQWSHKPPECHLKSKN